MSSPTSAAVRGHLSTRHGAPRSVGPRSARLASAALLATLSAWACGGKGADAAKRDSAAVPPASVAVDAVGKPGCPKTGKWDECNVLERLESAGLAPQRLEGERRFSFMRVPAIGYRVGHDTLDVFLYADASALSADLARLDTLRVQPLDSTIAWGATPTLMTSNNMAAILFSDRPTQIERVRLALTAGLPAAEKK